MNNKINLMEKAGMILVILIMIVLSVNFSSAFGVSSSSWKGNPLIVYPGDKETLSPIMLQNMVGTDDVTVRARIINGAEIASLEETEFNVKAGTKDTKVPIKLNISEDAKPGTTYLVTISFASVTTGETGVVLGTGMDTSFDILIGGTPPKEPVSANLTWILITGAGIIILVIIIALLAIKKRKK